LCNLQHKLIGFCNRDEKCLQRGTDWVFKYSSLRFVFKGLRRHKYETVREGFLDCLNLEDGKDRFSQNVGTDLQLGAT
jgi:hypothetical protein